MTLENLPPLIHTNSLSCIPYKEIMCDADQPSLSISSSSDLWEEQCELSFRNLKTVPVEGCRFALKNVSGVVKPGQILAIMGSSGSGKTTILNALSGRTPLESGRIYVNGEPICKRLRRTRIGYVLQHDVFFPTLTLKQTLVYSALLRLSDLKYTNQDKIKKVEDIIDVLDLYRCQHNPVGDDVTIRGLSGGEKKRLSIACELITNPSVLLIDEPTSGLDSFTATNLMTTLKHYAQKTNKNVILTVHQPSSKMFKMFDSLLAIANGQTAYFGPVSEMTTHMASLGLQIEPNYNPADFLLEKLISDEKMVLKGWNDENEDNLHILIEDNISGPSNPSNISFSRNTQSSWKTSFFTQVEVLTKRNFQLALPRIFSKINLVQTIILAFLAGFTWFQTPRVEDNLTNLEGWMFFSSNYWMLFVLFQALWAFPAERPMIEKERRSGAYRFSAYYFAKILGEAPLEMILPSVYLLISYPLMGGTIFAFMGILVSQILSSLAAQSVGLFFGSIMDSRAATTVAAIFTVAAQLLGGYLSTDVSTYYKIFSLVYNGLRNLQIIEFHYGNPIQCGIPSQSMFASCKDEGSNGFINAVDLLRKDETGFMFPFWSHSAVLFGVIVMFRVLSYLALKRIL